MTEQDKAALYEVLVGKCYLFKVVSAIEGGAFVNGGLAQDLFVPQREQLKPMNKGESCLVYVFRDKKTDRVTGSTKLDKYLYEDAPEGIAEGDPVDLFIYAQTSMGYKAVVNGDFWGLLYKNEIFQELRLGQRIKGYIKKIRPDRRIDLTLQKTGYQSVPDLSERIMKYLKTAGGTCLLSDKTPPEDIYRLFGVSKKKFKMAVGNLYKNRMLVIEQGAIKLVSTSKIEGK